MFTCRAHREAGGSSAPNGVNGGSPVLSDSSGTGGSSMATIPAGDATQAMAPRPRTRSQSGIRKEKVYTDGTIKYGMITSSGEPQNLEEALSDKNWKITMDDEYSALLRNQTWHLVPPRKGINVIDCKWVYKVKRKADGSLDRYKARLVAKGFKQ